MTRYSDAGEADRDEFADPDRRLSERPRVSGVGSMPNACNTSHDVPSVTTCCATLKRLRWNDCLYIAPRISMVIEHRNAAAGSPTYSSSANRNTTRANVPSPARFFGTIGRRVVTTIGAATSQNAGRRTIADMSSWCRPPTATARIASREHDDRPEVPPQRRARRRRRVAVVSVCSLISSSIVSAGGRMDTAGGPFRCARARAF